MENAIHQCRGEGVAGEVNGQHRCAEAVKSEAVEKIREMTKMMRDAAKLLDFEQAAYLRDRIKELREQYGIKE